MIGLQPPRPGTAPTQAATRPGLRVPRRRAQTLSNRGHPTRSRYAKQMGRRRRDAAPCACSWRVAEVFIAGRLAFLLHFAGDGGNGAGGGMTRRDHQLRQLLSADWVVVFRRFAGLRPRKQWKAKVSSMLSSTHLQSFGYLPCHLFSHAARSPHASSRSRRSYSQRSSVMRSSSCLGSR